MQTKLTVSIVIPTYEREQLLCNTITSLLTQAYKPYEIIVVDQTESHTIETQQFLESVKNKIKYYHLDIPNTSKAKNFGILKASGDIILFLDDDIEPIADLIKFHAENYRDDLVGGVAGRVVVADRSMIAGPEGVVGYVTMNGRFIDNFSSHTRCNVMTVLGCNASFRKQLLDKISGFDENYTGNAMREESDLSFRVRKLGFTLIFDPRAEVKHLKEKKGGTRSDERIRWYHDFFQNEMLFFMKNLNHAYLPLRILNKIRPILSCMLYYGKAQPRALITPFKGFWDGYMVYRKEKKEKSKWL